jgi:hypothetical protein
VRPSPTTAPVAASDPAQAVVRRYLDALIASNEDVAYGALGGASGDRGLSLKEEAFLDRDSRIMSIRTRTNDPAGATVDVEISATRGNYYATFHVRYATRGPYIDQHDYIKV